MSKENHIIIEKIETLLGEPICYAGGTIAKRNPKTLHHVKFVREGGLTTIGNCCIVAHLEHSGVHILADRSDYMKRDIYDYFMDRIEEGIRNKELDKNALINFQAWMQSELMRLGMRANETKDHVLIYKKRK